MTAHLVGLSIDAREPMTMARFWASLLDGEVVAGSDSAVVPGTDARVALLFTKSDAERRGLSRFHLHVTSDGPGDQQRLVQLALRNGGQHLDVGQLAGEPHVVLADPEGNEFCIIGPGNSFLAGCGRLGEIACDGSREVGLFWAAALGWPLVWDQDGETAIQSPAGGTKIAWGGPPVAPKAVTNRQRFVLSCAEGDPAIEIARLRGAGATLLSGPDVLPGDSIEATILADPDGNEFWFSL